MGKHSDLGLYAVAVAIVMVGIMAFDVPINALALLGLALICPLMMIVMMLGMSGGMRGHDAGSRDASGDVRRDEPRRR